jgi:Predicted dehydrogenases and related proteins
MIRIGVVNIDVSHPKAFSEYLKKGERARYVAVYNDGFRENDEVEAFIRNYNLEKRCKSIDELAECVDIGFIQSCNWDNHLKQAMPFIERGKPVFIDKPIAGSLADCLAVEELTAKGKVILGSSSLRYSDKITGFLALPEEERGEIVSIYGSAGLDEFNYGIHTVEPIEELANSKAESTRFIGCSAINGSICETYFVKFKNGITAVYNTFLGIWQPHELIVITTKSTFYLGINTVKVYGALLDRICDYMETGRNHLAPVSRITDAVKIMLAGRLSRERDGAEVRLDEIPADDPGYDGVEFSRTYAAAASKIYL